jgi:hypothetical protein
MSDVNGNSSKNLSELKVSRITYLKSKVDNSLKFKNTETLNDKERDVIENINSQISSIDYIDELGRSFKTIYYDDYGNIKGTDIYYYVDSSLTLMHKTESFNSEDSLIHSNVADFSDGNIIYLMHARGTDCFGYYEYKFFPNNLVKKAIWFSPKEGAFTNDEMIPTKEIVYQYTFY